jgi:hypothetical protein
MAVSRVGKMGGRCSIDVKGSKNSARGETGVGKNHESFRAVGGCAEKMVLEKKAGPI